MNVDGEFVFEFGIMWKGREGEMKRRKTRFRMSKRHFGEE